jgi:ATP-binding cassette subfamily C protein
MREQMLLRLSRIAMSEYETLGSGAVSSHFVKDLDAVDNFIGASVSKFLVAVLSIIGTAAVLLLMHWQLALFILLLNPAVIYFTMVLGKRVKDLKSVKTAPSSCFSKRSPKPWTRSSRSAPSTASATTSPG